MAQATIIFTDNEDGSTEVGLDIPNIEEQEILTPALYNATLISFIIERGYHMQFQDEFKAEYDKIMEEQGDDG